MNIKAIVMVATLALAHTIYFTSHAASQQPTESKSCSSCNKPSCGGCSK